MHTLKPEGPGMRLTDTKTWRRASDEPGLSPRWLRRLAVIVGYCYGRLTR